MDKNTGEHDLVKKRILLSNFHLQDRGGSELYTLELSSALMEAGHEVAVFCFIPGVISEKIKSRGIRVFVNTDRDFIEAFNPDIVHIHHLPCVYFLGSLDLNAAFIYSMLGPTNALELPPSNTLGISKFLVVSEEVRTKREKSIDNSIPMITFQNWFDDRNFPQQNSWTKINQPPRTHLVKKIAVVTNHLDPELKTYLLRLCNEDPSVTWQHFGLPDNVIEMTPEALMPFDAVITIGRTVLLAAALEKPVFIHDIHGADGWLTEKNFDAIAYNNFSGRTYAQKHSFEEWKKQLLESVNNVDVLTIANRVITDFSLSKRVQQLEALYNTLERNSLSTVITRKKSYVNEAKVFADLAIYVVKAHQLTQQLNCLQNKKNILKKSKSLLKKFIAKIKQ